jgi:hypothetical protein
MHYESNGAGNPASWTLVRPPVHTPTGHTKCRMEYDCGGDEIKVIAAVTGMGATQTIVVTAFDKDREE